MRKNILASLLALGLIVGITGCGGTIIKNVPAQPVAQHLSQDSVFTAIDRAGMKRGWDMQNVSNGLVEATYARRGFTVTISIHYNTHSYSIDYKSSKGLGYKEQTQTIHKNYNSWIASLKKQINKELGRVSMSGSQQRVNAPVSAAPATSETKTTSSRPSNDW